MCRIISKFLTLKAKGLCDRTPPTAPVSPDAYLRFMPWAEHLCPQNFCAESLPRGDGVRRWGSREDDGKSELMKSPQGPLTSSAMWSHSEKTPSSNRGVCPQETANVLLP